MDSLFLIVPYYNYNNSKVSKRNLDELFRSEFDERIKIVFVEGLLPGQKPTLDYEDVVFKHYTFPVVHKLWIQHNLINLALRSLPSWEYAIWLDRDIRFRDVDWADKVLNKFKSGIDLFQPFSECVFLGEDNLPSVDEASVFFNQEEDGDKNFKIISYCKSLKENIPSDKKTVYRHPGQTWCISRKFFERVGGIFDVGILGANDLIMCSFLNPNFIKSTKLNFYSRLFEKAYFSKYLKFSNVDFDYLDGLIFHKWHGDTKKRLYYSRYEILIEDSDFVLDLDICYSKEGVIMLTDRGLRILPKIEKYFSSRMD